MRTLRFPLVISAEELLRYYRGEATTVMVRTEGGLRVRFPAKILRPFVTEDGIRGRFALQLDAGNRLKGIRRIG